MDISKSTSNRLEELSEELLEKAVNYLKDLINEDEKDLIREEYMKLGEDWFAKYHNHWGMFIRNQLRKECGIEDGLLPSENWDDYYVGCVEIAVGVRDLDYYLEEERDEE